MLNQRTLILSSLLMLLAVSANAQKVNVAYDRTVDFSKFKTYSWTKGVPAKNPQIDQQIIALIEQQLAAKGLQRASENADLNISYHAAVMTGMDQASVAKPDDTIGKVTWVPQMGSMSQVWLVQVGSLIVVLKEPKGNQEVWRATATDTLSNDPNKDLSRDVNKATRKVKKVVEKMFKGFPPK